MFRAALKTIISNIRKNQGFAIINIFGFTLGISSFILILLFVFSELSYDRFNEKADRIYRLSINAMVGETRINQTFSSARMFWEMREKYPEIENGVKFISFDNVYNRAEEKIFHEPVVLFSDSTVFDIFTLPFLEGNPAGALNRPNTVVLSETGTRKYFGSADPVGQNIEMDLPSFGKRNFEVTAVIKDIPYNSHFHFDVLGSLVSFPDLLNNKEWSANNFLTYYLLKQGTSPGELEAKLKNYFKETFGEDKYKAWTDKGNYWEFKLQPLTSIHLRSHLNGEFEPNGNIRYVYIFLVVAFFVLSIACINFMNLSTAKSILRAREVGIKKTVGWTRLNLIGQFLLESVILTLISLILALAVVGLVLPIYGQWLGRELTLRPFAEPLMILAFIFFIVFIGFISGIYPAFFLSSYNPVKVLKVQALSERKGLGLRNVLVIVQFMSSIFLIIGTLVISQQINYIQDKDLGFTKDNVIVIRTPPAFKQVSEVFKNEMRQQAGVVDIASSNSLPGFSFNNIGFGADSVDHSFTLNLITCEPAFGKILNLQMVEGRFFSEEFPTDSAAIILNETAVKVLGLKNALGMRFNDWRNPRNYYHVIGVVKDFNYESIHSEIRPLGLLFMGHSRKNPSELVSIKTIPGKSPEVAKAAELAWQKLMPGIPVSYSYLANDYNNLYRNEFQTRQVFTLLAILSIIVAMLGLLGLASFMAQRKNREIAIRKVFGAAIGQVMGQFAWKFTRWVIIAFMLASPLAWWTMHRWLENFTYRVSLSAWIFLLAGFLTLCLAIITISLITYRVASTNPAKVLKSE